MPTELGANAVALRSPLRSDANEGLVALITVAEPASGARARSSSRRPAPRSSSAADARAPLQTTADEIERAGATCLPIAADVRDSVQVEHVVGAAIDRFGAIDVLVNNAGGQFSAPAEEITDNGWRAVHRLAVDAAWTVTRTVAVRSMIPRRGGLVVFVGFSPLRGVPGFAHACAARAAVANLAAGLALEWSRHRIRTVCLALGTILTEGLAAYGEDRSRPGGAACPLAASARPRRWRA